jgi:hypothetical protein
MTWDEFTRRIEDELQLSGPPFDRADLIAFVDCNRPLIYDAQEPALWAERFSAFVREKMEIVSS